MNKMKTGKIIRKYKGKCLNCKKPKSILIRASSDKWCREHEIGVGNFHCSKKCEKEFKQKLDKVIAFSEGYEKATKDVMKKLRKEIKWIKSHMKEIKHPNNGYHQGSIDILEIVLKSLADVKAGKIKRVT